MIPVIDKVIIEFDIDKLEDMNYKKLLYNQLNFADANSKFIIKKENLFYVKVSNFNVRLNKRCVNFKLLENKFKEYKGV